MGHENEVIGEFRVGGLYPETRFFEQRPAFLGTERDIGGRPHVPWDVGAPVGRQQEPLGLEQTPHLGQGSLPDHLVQQVHREYPVGDAAFELYTVVFYEVRPDVSQARSIQPFGEEPDHLRALVYGVYDATGEAFSDLHGDAAATGAVVHHGLRTPKRQQVHQTVVGEYPLALGTF